MIYLKLTDEEWEQVKKWLEGYRVSCRVEEKNAKHPKIAKFHKDINIKVREFLFSKE